MKFPPVTVLDSYNILGARSLVAGKITMENDKPDIKFSSRSFADVRIFSYKPEKNMVTCNYTFPGADPQHYYKVTSDIK